jgi:hypothetical protein
MEFPQRLFRRVRLAIFSFIDEIGTSSSSGTLLLSLSVSIRLVVKFETRDNTKILEVKLTVNFKSSGILRLGSLVNTYRSFRRMVIDKYLYIDTAQHSVKITSQAIPLSETGYLLNF